jgi:hypothetical protein
MDNRLAILVSIRRSASTRAVAQSRSIVDVAGRTVRGATALDHEATGDILVRHRHLGFPEQPILQLARTTSGEGAESVERPQLGKMLVPRLLASGIVNEIVGIQAELRSDELDDLRRNQLARSQHPTRIAQDA